MQLLESPSRVQLNNILLVTRFPPWADVAVPYTLGLALDHGARTHVIHPVPTYTFQKLSELPMGGAYRRNWRDLMYQATARQGVVDADMLVGRLREISERHDFDLIVVSFDRAEESNQRTLTKTLEHTFNAADCPVLVIGPAVQSGAVPRSAPATILHATDFSPHALAAAQHAFSWAQEYQSWITLLHVVEGGVSGADAERKLLERPFQDWMQELVPAQLPVWCEVEKHIAFGRPGEEIVRAADQLHADLIVIGLTGMDAASSQEGAGVTALQVIAEASCPVLLVRDYMKPPAARSAAVCERRESLTATAA